MRFGTVSTPLTVYKSQQYQTASHAHCTFLLLYFWHCTWETKINNR